MASSETDDNKITAFYDGKCPMCTALMDRVGRSEQGGAFDLRDMHADAAIPFASDAVEREIHLVARDGKVHRGADAILKILEQFPRWRWLAVAGATPVTRPLLPIGYAFVAANRRFLFGAASRIFWLKVAVVIAFCVGLAMSTPLWIGPRSYPVAPAFDALVTAPDWLNLVLFVALFALAALILLSAQPQRYMLGFVAILVVFCVLDVTRWQPWVYLYGLLLLTLGLFSWNPDDQEGRNRTLNIARLVMAGTYVFSGLQKINAEFVQYVFPELVLPLTKMLPAAEYPLYLLGFAAPALQIAFGVGLLTRRFRRLSLALAVAMHVFILLMVGPLGDNWNSIIWPWTTAMVIFDLLLFTSKAEFSVREILWSKGSPLHAVVLALLVIMPALSFLNLWDSYLSAALYSGNVTEAVIYVSDAGKAALPDDVRTHVKPSGPGTHELDVLTWALGELNVTPYPETRVYKAIARRLCARMDGSDELMLQVREQRLFRSSPEASYRCAEL